MSRILSEFDNAILLDAINSKQYIQLTGTFIKITRSFQLE